MGIANPRHFLTIPPDSAGKTLSMRIRSQLGNIGVGPHRFGRPLDVAKATFQSVLARLTVTVIIILIGLLSLLIPIFLRGGREYLLFGFFLITGGIYLFSRSFLALKRKPLLEVGSVSWSLRFPDTQQGPLHYLWTG